MGEALARAQPRGRRAPGRRPRDPLRAPTSTAATALATRVGYGSGEQVADGRLGGGARAAAAARAAALDARSRRRSGWRRCSAGRDVALACEELALRARLDLDQGREREAALQLLAGARGRARRARGLRASAAVATRLDELHGHRGRRRGGRGRARRAGCSPSRPRRSRRRWGGSRPRCARGWRSCERRGGGPGRMRLPSTSTSPSTSCRPSAAFDDVLRASREAGPAGGRRLAAPGPAARAAGPAAAAPSAILEVGTLGGLLDAVARPRRCRPAAGSSRSRSTRTTPRSRARTSTGPAWATRSRSWSARRSRRCRGVEGPFDLVFIDADKERSADYLALALEQSRPGTLIVVDNVVRGGALADPDDDDPRVLGVAPGASRRSRAEPRLRRHRPPDRRREGLGRDAARAGALAGAVGAEPAHGHLGAATSAAPSARARARARGRARRRRRGPSPRRRRCRRGGGGPRSAGRSGPRGRRGPAARARGRSSSSSAA